LPCLVLLPSTWSEVAIHGEGSLVGWECGCVVRGMMEWPIGESFENVSWYVASVAHWGAIPAFFLSHLWAEGGGG